MAHWTDAERQIVAEMHAAGEGDQMIAAATKRTRRAVRSMRFILGLVGPASEMREMPNDFVSYATDHSTVACAAHFGASLEIIQRWRVQTKTPPPIPGKMPPPDWFAADADKMTIGASAARADVSGCTVRRWYAETGVRPVRVKARRVHNAPAPAAVPADMGLAAQAATMLRRYHPNVYRATVLDLHQRAHLPNNGANHYFVSGKGFIPAAEMIELARAKGFGRNSAAA